MDNVQKETHAVKTDQYKETCSVVRDEKDDRFFPHQISKAKTDEGRETSSKTSGNREESSSDKRSEIPCRYKNLSKKSCKFWHPPVCQNCKSETGCKCVEEQVSSDMLELRRSPA